MAKFVIDAYAWIEYFDGREKGRKAAEIIESKNNSIFTAAVTVSEIVSKLKRHNKDPTQTISAIKALSTIVVTTLELSIIAGTIHATMKHSNKYFGMLDAFVAATAQQLGAKILTGDPDFHEFKDAIFI